MQRSEDGILLSPADLTGFLACRHRCALSRRSLDEDLPVPEETPTAQLLQDLGLARERRFLTDLQREGRRVVRIPGGAPLPERWRLTGDALREGADVIYQAVLRSESWLGIADFLLRVEAPSRLGAWSYEPADAKLSGTVLPPHAVQLTIYAELLAAVQGLLPRRMLAVLGDGRTAELRPADFASYVRLAQGRLERFLADPALWRHTTPEPCAYCEQCPWKDRCAAAWEEADHLSLVANIRRSQRDRLTAAGITTLTALAEAPADLPVRGMAPHAWSRLKAQARAQLEARRTGHGVWELLPTEPGRGFSSLPPPDPGDLFFDMEGDPLYVAPDGGERGLEYLFGVHRGSPENGRFHAFWAHDRTAERLALEQFLGFVFDQLARHPRAHIYHYNHYEVTAVRRLAMRHATRETQVDELLRREKFVDLFRVVREALLIGEPRYSLKNIEHFYLPAREGEVATAGDSLVAYERWRVTGEPATLEEIERYNALDCRSTAALRDWLLGVRPADVPWFEPEAAAPDETALARQAAAQDGRAALEAALLDGAADEEQPFRRLVAQLVEFHRREQKPAWWALFDRRGRDPQELVEDAECLGHLTLAGPPRPEKRSLLYPYRFPPQETKLKRGSRPLIVDTLEPAGTIEALDPTRGSLLLKRSAAQGPLPDSLSLGPPGPVNDAVLREAVRRFAQSVADGDGRFAALEALLRRDPPRLAGRRPGEPLASPGADPIPAAIAAVSALENSYLFIQGPPGTGKTFTASRVIVELLRRGRRVGVSSNSHKAINNLLVGVERAAREQGYVFAGYKKATEGDPDSHHRGKLIVDVTRAQGIPTDAPLVAGTAWLFALTEFEGAFDYLFVDEAGQVSLANLVAMGVAARNIVLVGDQMQLGQPIQGTHPDASGVSVLDHLLQGEAVVPASRGIFLDLTWRMHPQLCGFISQAVYRGRLGAHPSTERQRLVLDADAHPLLSPHGLAFVPVEHAGRSQHSPEEVELIRQLWTNLQGQHWRDAQGREHPLGPADVLVVAPYNVQVNALRRALPELARVGTVDKFQGQEAVVVLISLTTSSREEIPRDLEFLFSRNRLNVAISRARCLSLLLASPQLLNVNCGTVDELRLVNLLCRASEWPRAAPA